MHNGMTVKTRVTYTASGLHVRAGKTCFFLKKFLGFQVFKGFKVFFKDFSVQISLNTKFGPGKNTLYTTLSVISFFEV